MLNDGGELKLLGGLSRRKTRLMTRLAVGFEAQGAADRRWKGLIIEQMWLGDQVV